MQRDDELQALEKLKGELGRKGLKLNILLKSGLEEMDDIDALQKLQDIKVSQYMEEQIYALQSKGYKLFENRIDDKQTPEEEKIRMELRQLRKTLRHPQVLPFSWLLKEPNSNASEALQDQESLNLGSNDNVG